MIPSVSSIASSSSPSGNNNVSSSLASRSTVGVTARSGLSILSSNCSSVYVECIHEKQCAIKGFLRDVSLPMYTPNFFSLPQKGHLDIRFFPAPSGLASSSRLISRIRKSFSSFDNAICHYRFKFIVLRAS